MKLSKVSGTARVTLGCCFIAAIAIVAISRGANAQDDPTAIDPTAIDPTAMPHNRADSAAADDLADASPTFEVSAACESSYAPRCCPRWQVWTSAIFMTRNSSSGQSLIYEGPKGNEIFRTDDLDFGVAWGPSVGITYCIDPCNPGNRIGVEFYAIDGWSSTLQAAGNISVQFPSLPYLPELGVPGVPESGFGIASSRYVSNLYNTEINFYHQSRNISWLTTLAGFRWIEIGEDFSTVFATGATTPGYTIDVNNHLYGFQVGALAKLADHGPWRFDGWLKAGIFGNAADQATTEDFRSAGGSLISASASASNVAYAGNLGISASRRITDRLSLRVSYMALWVEGIALAPEQLDNSDPSSGTANLDHSDGTFYQGGFIGGEIVW